jgi:hypothetical protein
MTACCQADLGGLCNMPSLRFYMVLTMVYNTKLLGFQTVHHPDSKELENTTIRKLIYFCPQVRGGTYSVGSLRES